MEFIRISITSFDLQDTVEEMPLASSPTQILIHPADITEEPVDVKDS